jgi:hypothetical protein
MIGSNTGYNYGDDSDIDVDVNLKDVTADEAFAIFKEHFFDSKKLTGTNNDINYYLNAEADWEEKLDVLKTGERGNAYSVLDDVWIVKQEDKIQIPFSYVANFTKIFMSGLDDKVQEYELSKLELDYYTKLEETDEVKDQIDGIKRDIESSLDSINFMAGMIHEMRKEGYNGDIQDSFIEAGRGNLSVQNMAYKVLEKMGYKEKISKYVKIRENLKQGIKDGKFMLEAKIDELAEGIKIEHEHKPTYDKISKYYEHMGKMPPEETVYEWIAKDHLAEFKQYYTYLIAMEEEMKAKMESKKDLLKVGELGQIFGTATKILKGLGIIKKEAKFTDTKSVGQEEEVLGEDTVILDDEATKHVIPTNELSELATTRG